MKKLIYLLSMLATGISLYGCSALYSGSISDKPKDAVVDSRIGQLSFDKGYPSSDAVEKLYDTMDFQRACQAYIWGLPMLATQAFVHSFKTDLGGEWGDLIEVKTFRDRSFGITANATTDYMFTWVNLAETGPMVIDVPPGLIAGFISDVWQRAPADLGVPGDFRGKGAKHILIGPDQALPDQASGYNVIQSKTNHNMILIRIVDPNPKVAAKLREAFQIFPFAEVAAAPKTKIIPVGGRVWKTTQPEGFAYWEGMAELINQEPAEERDRLIYAMLVPLGIEKGKPFEPEARQKRILEEALVVGEAMAKSNGFMTRHPDAEYVAGSRWDFPLVVSPTQRLAHYDDLDGRAAWTYEALGISRGMTTTKVGVGSIYLGAYQSTDGQWLDGSKHYQLHIPPNPPAKNFWSVTLYHNLTRYLIQNPQQIADKSSRGDIRKNDDGSVDLYFGPSAPKGQEKNWIPTNPDEAWFAYFRLYGPLEPFFDRSWVLPDIESVN